jgi:alpha-tubulin suppressor-like RCC1 family protein
MLPVVNRHAVLSWGANDSAQLGNGTTQSSTLPGAVSGLGTGVIQVSAGDSHSLAVRSDGSAWAWGSNLGGQLGDGSYTAYGEPIHVPGLTQVIQVAAGAGHSLALRSDGTVWAWGDNNRGQIGDGQHGLNQLRPVKVKVLTGVTAIAAGNFFSLALRSDGTVWAWGDNTYGQLGNGTEPASAVPVQVPGLSQVTKIAAGDSMAYAARTTGITARTSLWAWGSNDNGQLGDGTTTSRPVPGPVTGINAPSIAGIAAGKNGFAFALGSDGTVWGWGEDIYDELGFATTGAGPVLTPVKIGTGSPITQLSASTDHVLALRPDGTVLAWGVNLTGALGNGSTSDNPTLPVQAAGLTGATQVSAGGSQGAEFSLAVYLPAQYR